MDSLSMEMTQGWVSHCFAPAEAEEGKRNIFGSSEDQKVLKEAEGGFSKHTEFIEALTCKQGINL